MAIKFESSSQKPKDSTVEKARQEFLKSKVYKEIDKPRKETK